mmetsp:Transcript_25314/g.22335  ORF Transcript_25314/g.22335 Transcript_25314/m.22335 type:complete len:150 (-) Transcript_25314:378-827(-)|eukprot:CAMPEP_0114582910 /NCGR_PEP_ID=MMETSP0125-20121206/6767_1 /TAXON_ID=485358 ORGANISM="Aristerostoma sp., Strain ATCC 50986" /NCGR_SAMPLE_ID=MMETSP0125 /ASSEMBLY_ACC=CAM_ASM_000245 /LENGTH=149 /DNA_ID=CAMNT_0001776087 /DNA_START=294 /DNA_END=743 /DNA_ORIENTATION=-
MEVTAKTLKCMRKYGGFDNYILLTKPHKMDSLYGEYLRKLMYLKINKPDYKIPYIVRHAKKQHVSKRKRLMKSYPTFYVPQDLRYTDLWKLRLKIDKKDLNRNEYMDIVNRERLAQADEIDEEAIREIDARRSSAQFAGMNYHDWFESE